jgi:hypothetical protein
MGNKPSTPAPASAPAPPPTPSVVDWSVFRDTARVLTFEELAHYARTGITPYTVALLQALCSQITISARAGADLAVLRKTLVAVSDERARCVLLDLTASDYELVVLGILGILNETFRQEALALVFRALDVASAVPDDLRPLYHSWDELNGLCGQVQLPAAFHERVERFSRLNDGAADAPEMKRDVELEHIGPQVVVDGLQAMSRSCSGEEEDQILVLAGQDAGWYAAVAEWMFELRIEIQDQDWRVLYTNCEGLQAKVQMTIAFHNRGVPCDGSEPMEDEPLPRKG